MEMNIKQAVDDYVVSHYGADVAITSADMDMDKLAGLVADAIQWAIEDYVDGIISEMGNEP